MPWIPVIIAASVLTAIAGVAYGRDQGDKREEEQNRARAAIAELAERISKFERKRGLRRLLGNLRRLLGKKNR